jgi:hypothetical protein
MSWTIAIAIFGTALTVAGLFAGVNIKIVNKKVRDITVLQEFIHAIDTRTQVMQRDIQYIKERLDKWENF